jgi:hypothetical protein
MINKKAIDNLYKDFYHVKYRNTFNEIFKPNILNMLVDMQIKMQGSNAYKIYNFIALVNSDYKIYNLEYLLKSHERNIDKHIYFHGFKTYLYCLEIYTVNYNSVLGEIL